MGDVEVRITGTPSAVSVFVDTRNEYTFSEDHEDIRWCYAQDEDEAWERYYAGKLNSM